ncbi:hypothetical protein B0F90DRAFT_1718343 [Multifurca ochricompacta]|uniref:Uncharacterized protein n=1 Tax=Multifurca ochricompacta TaxID=376703 RepID=A0AAD4QNV2_9AGAM|nr:hypothetical protein B0F90DRAFT_1718343 [Multifurca ochricompacta]
MKQPCGPFDFSVIDSKQESSFIYSGHPAVSSKRAHSVPLVSQRDLGQLMPSPRKTPLVSPQREVLRFSSLPRILEPLADDMSILNIAMLPSYPEHAKYLAESHVSPTTKELGPVSSCEVPAMGVNNVSSHNGFSSVASSLEVIDSSLSPGAPSLLSDVGAPSLLARLSDLLSRAVPRDKPPSGDA